MSTEIVTYQEKVGALSLTDVRGQVALIHAIMTDIMKRDEHFGVIPGTGTKPTLLKAGAEKLCLTFRLDPEYEITQEKDGQHLTILSKCTLWHIPSGQRYGSGMGSCSTKESKYAWRKASRKCPECGKEAIIKGKEQYGGGWVCFKKKDGCGAKFQDGDQAIESQIEGRVPNEDIADQYNTVLKMANKRSLVAAVLNTTAASDIFTQDIEDMAQFEPRTESAPPPASPSSADSPVIPTAGGAEAAPRFINADQAIALEDRCKEVGKAGWQTLKSNLLTRINRVNKSNITMFSQLPPEDYDSAMTWLDSHDKSLRQFEHERDKNIGTLKRDMREAAGHE